MKIVDIGGFDGFFAYKLWKTSNIKPLVLDIDKRALEHAKRMGLETVEATAENMPFNDASIDGILCLDVIEHISEDSKLLTECYRVLKKDGILILTTPKKEKQILPFYRNTARLHKKWGHVRSGYTKQEICDLLAKSGFHVKYVTGYFNIINRAFYFLFFILKPSFARVLKLRIWNTVLPVSESLIQTGYFNQAVIVKK